jgi:hypothetical protein
MGIERLKEALVANDWEGIDELSDDINPQEFGDEAGSDGEVGFGINPTEIEDEMVGMKQAIYGGGIGGEDEIGEGTEQDEEVVKLQAMMLRMQAVRGRVATQVFRDPADYHRFGRRYARSRKEEICCEGCQRNNEVIIEYI